MARTKQGIPVLVRMTERGTITLPKTLRAKAKSDLFEVALRDDGVYELRPRVLTDPSQAWFWTEEWQEGERKVDEEYAAGRYETLDGDAFLAELDRRMKPLD